MGGQSRAAPPSPRASRKFTTEMSESSSCGSDTSERLFLSPHPATRQVVCFNKVVHHLPPPSPTYHYRDNYYIIIIFGNVIVLHGNQLPKVKIVYLLTIVSILTNCHKLSQITTNYYICFTLIVLSITHRYINDCSRYALKSKCK